MIRTISILFVLFFSVPVLAQGWVWGRGSIGNNITSWSVAADTKGNVFVAGISAGPVSFDNNSPSFPSVYHQYVLAKYDLRSDFLWARNIQIRTNAFLINITTDTTGNCYLLGWMADSSITIGAFTLYNAVYPNAQYFIAKYDPQGDVIWAKNAGGRSGSETVPPIVLNNTNTVKILGLGAIASDQSNNIYVATGFNLPSVTAGNYTLVNKDTSGASDDIMLVKYDSSGNVVWAKSSGGSGEDIPCGLTVTPAGSIYIAGIFNSDSAAFGASIIKDTSAGLQKWNAFIARYNYSGNPTWANGSSGTGKVYAVGVASDASNNVYLTGGTAENSISFDSTIIIDSNFDKPVLYLVKFDTSNKVNWYKTIGSPTGGVVWGYSISAYPGGGIWVSGAFSDEVNIAGHVLDTPATSIDPIFIAGFDISGYYIGSAALQSGSSEQVGIACDIWGDVYLCADYKYPCSPFIIAHDVLADVTSNEKWQYLAQYSGGGGPGGGPITIYDSFYISICPYDSISLIAPPGYAIYHWNDGTSDTSITVTMPGTYWVTGIGNANSMVIDSFRVKTDIALCDCNVFLASAFTPNGDGKNDSYAPVFESGCSITHYAFSIYNRWGQRVFYSENPYAKWDGKFEGINADLGVYMYYLKYTTNPNYPEHVKKGDITLMR